MGGGRVHRNGGQRRGVGEVGDCGGSENLHCRLVGMGELVREGEGEEAVDSSLKSED